MIWYLLYPFRGTTEPPVLAPDHPLRRASYRYGIAAARHWLAFILGSVAIAVLLCYPVFFLYENPTTGFSKLPYHVWTSARLYDGDPEIHPDVEVRQVWVHGDYKKAFDKSVLQEALSIQNILVADNQQANGLIPQSALESDVLIKDHDNICRGGSAIEHPSWGFHSPLMFWDCSIEALKSDADIIDTINSQVDRQSYLNLTLRPTSVFAGKSFINGKVVEADALVITLFDRVAEHNKWDDKLDLLAKESPARWSLYPRDGHVTRSRLYEFQQMPLSRKDDFFLAGSYILMLVYVVRSMSKLRAVKSWTGLLITLIFQMFISIIASFSICGMLQIDLARIPDAEYPFVVLVIGLENMFRLINAVLTQPPELPTIHRVATALSEVAHLSLATAAQMLLILWILSKVASGISAFCAFAAIALVFDFFFHFTFFLAVVSVDVRRMELSDSLDRVDVAKSRGQHLTKAPPERQFFLNTLLLGRGSLTSRIATSRIAGIVISICFILGLNVHFFESGNPIWSFLHSLQSMFRSHPIHQTTPFIAPPINQARTPAGWLRMQDYRYAKEVLQFVKPNVHHIVVRVYDPLIVVLHHANRVANPSADTSFFATWWVIIRKHIYPFILTLIFSVAVVTFLMQYMLWNEISEDEPEADLQKRSTLTIDTLPQAHRLDVVKLTACTKGHIISVSLDRLVSFSLFNPLTHKYSLNVLTTVAMTPPLWPIIATALDENGTWAALCTQDGNVAFWNLLERRVSHFVRVDLKNQQLCAFSFVVVDTAEKERPRLVIVSNDAVVTEIDVLGSKIVQSFRISQEKLVLTTISRSKAGVNVIALLLSGRIRIATRNAGDWVTAAAERLNNRLAPGSREGKIKSFTSIPSLSSLAAIRLRVVDLVDIKTSTLIHTFPAVLVKGNSLRVLSSPRRECKACHSTAVHSISFAYTDFETQTCIIRTYTLSNDYNDLMCLAPTIPGTTSICPGPSAAKEQNYSVDEPGSWESTNGQAIVGIRRRPSTIGTPPSTSSSSSGSDAAPLTAQPAQGLKLRSRTSLSASILDTSRVDGSVDTDEWEMWTMSSHGEFHTEPLPTGPNELFVANAGPIVPLGNKSVALGFGNKIKVVIVGNERFESDPNEFQDLALAQIGGSRRRRNGLKRI